MMKLKHLFDNRDLAKMLLDNWEYDIDSIDLFKYYRISANAIYPFKINDKVHFLRFAPASEKSLDNVYAELEFLDYLRSMDYPCVGAVSSIGGNKLEVKETPWGEYYASVFKGVPGIPIDEADSDEHMIFGYGKSLGKLHRFSSEYSPKTYKRWSWNDVIDWICEVLSDFPDEKLACKEAIMLKEYLSNLPVTKKNFGLVHYDFETDNVFYDKESESFYPIDFDDAMYHWFVTDIDQAIDSMREHIDKDRYEHSVECFIDGYRSEFEVSDDMLSIMPVFRRFANLYGYARILRLTAEKWQNEPEWMVKLREYLKQPLRSRSAHFGESFM